MDHVIKIEKAGDNWFAHVPALPGCMATGDTIEEVHRNIRTAIPSHLEALREIEEEAEKQ